MKRALLIGAGALVLAGGLALWAMFGNAVVLSTFRAMCG